MNTPILKITAKEAAIVNSCYAVLTEECENKGYEALDRLAKLLAGIVVRNIWARQAQFSNRMATGRGLKYERYSRPTRPQYHTFAG